MPVRKRKIARRLRLFLDQKGVQDKTLQPRLLLINADEERFDRLTDHVVGLLRRDAQGELKQALESGDEDDDDADPAHPILAMLVQFFIDHWEEILQLILSFFMTPGNLDSLEFSGVSVSSIEICNSGEDWDQQMQSTRREADEILRKNQEGKKK